MIFFFLQLIVWSHWEQGLRVSGPTVIQIGGWKNLILLKQSLKLTGYAPTSVRAARPIFFPLESFKRKIGYFEVKIIRRDE